MKLTAALAAAALVLAAAGAGSAGTDPAYGTSGTALLATGTLPFSLVTDGQGRAVVGGFAGQSGFVERLTQAGIGDTSFGTNGVVPFATQVPSVAADSLDRVLGVGGATAFRLTTTGAADSTFGTGGATTLPFAAGVIARMVAVDAGDRPVVLGQNASSGRIELARLATDGLPDTTFGGTGIVDLGTVGGTAALAVGSGGRIFVGSTTGGNATVTALLDGGTVDSSFGTAGVATIDAGGNDAVNALAIDGAGDIVIGATSIPGQSPAAGRPFAARLDSSGKLDTAFGSNGIAEPALPAGSTGGLDQGVAAGPGGRIALASPTFGGTSPAGALYVLDSTGALDGTYVPGGLQTAGWNMTAATFDGSGGLLAAGQFGPPVPGGFVRRFVASTAPVVPTVSVPASPVAAEATGPGGATVTFAVTAAEGGAPVPVTCSPASGSTFALGDTTVSCTATDANGGSSSASFTVRVVDTTAPSLTLTNVTVDATGPNGASVAFTPTASDLVDGVVLATCVPPSGSTLAIGSTTVTCAATDAHGNTASGTFVVTVRSAAEQLAALKHAAAPYPALAKKLTGVVLSNAHRACTQLEQFARAALREPGGTAGTGLAARARRVEAVLGSC